MRLNWLADERRVRKALGGDRQSASLLVADHYAGVLRFLLHLSGDLERAEDLAQETFLCAWQRLDTYGGRSSFKTWIHSIAYRQFLADSGRANLLSALDDTTASPTIEFASNLLDAVTLEQAVLSLPLDLRVTFLLLYVQELSAQEVAMALNIPRGTVLSRSASAREKLARCLSSFESGGEGRPKSEKSKRERSHRYEITTTPS